MHQPLISIIVPVHNAAGTLEAAARSALDQTYPNLELILVDDGSTDEETPVGDGFDGNRAASGNAGKGSAALCDALAASDARIHAVHMEDRGVSAARNLGLDEACGDRIAFLDADDVLHPSMLRVLSDLLDRTGADYAGCGFERRQEGETPFTAEGDAQADGGQGRDAELCGPQILIEGTLHPDHPDTRVWSKLFCREYIGTTRFREGLTIGEDMLFLVDLVRQDTRYVQVQEKLYSYYINPCGAMERPFAPNHMDTLRCRDLAQESLRVRFPELVKEPDVAARLAAQQLIAAVLTASKIAKLPAGQQTRYEREFETCRDTIRRCHRVPGAAAYLPQGYSLKIRMLLGMPGIYRKLYR